MLLSIANLKDYVHIRVACYRHNHRLEDAVCSRHLADYYYLPLVDLACTCVMSTRLSTSYIHLATTAPHSSLARCPKLHLPHKSNVASLNPPLKILGIRIRGGGCRGSSRCSEQAGREEIQLCKHLGDGSCESIVLVTLNVNRGTK
jgi:hypothetical protein